MTLSDLPEHEHRRVAEYVASQLRDPDDEIEVLQKVGVRKVLGRTHDLYDVRTTKGRWWVISDLMNLYAQEDFQSLEMAFTYHLGVCLVLSERSRVEVADDEWPYISGAWRRFEQAVEAFNGAGEAEAFQAVGVYCREALLALVRERSQQELVAAGDSPKGDDFKGWAACLAERLAQGRVRGYLKTVSERTWDLTVWLQHNKAATTWDAEIVLDATANVLGVFAYAFRKDAEGEPPRCPDCHSYRVTDDGARAVVGELEGWRAWRVCAACEWRSESTFAPWPE